MKYTNFTLIIALGASTSTFAAQAPEASLIPQQSTFYSLYNGMVNSITNLASSWNDKKNAIIATAAIAALLINYKKESIINWINDLIVQPTKEGKELSKKIRVLSEKELQEESAKKSLTKRQYEMLLQEQLQQQEEKK